MSIFNMSPFSPSASGGGERHQGRPVTWQSVVVLVGDVEQARAEAAGAGEDLLQTAARRPEDDLTERRGPVRPGPWIGGEGRVGGIRVLENHERVGRPVGEVSP